MGHVLQEISVMVACIFGNGKSRERDAVRSVRCKKNPRALIRICTSMHIPIVSDAHNGAFELIKELFEPGDTLGIKVIRRLFKRQCFGIEIR